MARVLAKPVANFILNHFNQTLQANTSLETWENYVAFLEDFENNEVEKMDFFDNIPLNAIGDVQEEFRDIIVKKNELKTIIRHRLIANNQRKAYYNMKGDADFLKDKVLIDLDFKQQITLGLGPVQISSEYRVADEDKKMVNCLSFGIHYRDKFINEDDEEEYFVNCLNVDVISDCKDSRAATVIKYFEHVMQQFPAYFNEPNFIIWSDCGKLS
jgi:hypothetical protein